MLGTAVFLPPIPEGGKQGRVLLRVHYKQEQSRIKHSDEFFISTQLKTVTLLGVNSDVRIFQIVCYGIQNLQEQVSAQSPEIRRFCNLQWEKGENRRVSYLIAHTRETSREMSRKMSCLWRILLSHVPLIGRWLIDWHFTDTTNITWTSVQKRLHWSARNLRHQSQELEKSSALVCSF